VVEQAENVILRYPRFSPDGNYITYLSWENRSPTTFIRELRGDGRWVVPNSYESQVSWSPQGDALFYSSYEGGAEMSRISVETSPVFKLGRQEELFSMVLYEGFDVRLDGNQLLVVGPAGEQGAGQSVAVVQNWWAEFAE
jgi:Tol biopolymer transport system component